MPRQRKTNTLWSLVIVAMVMAGWTVPSAKADDTARQIADLKKRVGELEKAASDCQFNKKKRFGIRCKDWEGYIFGRLQYDVLLMNPDKAAYRNADDFMTNGLDDSGSGLRRARFGIGGQFFDHWQYKLEYDAASSAPIKDAYIRYVGTNPFYVQMGNAKAPFSLDELTSSRFTIFMERGLTTKNPSIPGRVLGLTAGYGSKRWSLHGAILGDKYDNKTKSFGLAGRLTVAPLLKKGRYYTHIGFSSHLRKSGRCVDNKCPDWGRLRDRSPYTPAVLNGYVYDLDLPDWRTMIAYNPEIAFGWGAVGFQAEYRKVDMTYRADDGDDPDPSFSSWYMQANWWITGEHNIYHPAKGAFGRVRPLRRVSEGGLGAIGVALRYQSANFATKIKTQEGKLMGGGDHAMTWNVTWKPNAYVKFMGEYVKSWRSFKACNGVCVSKESPDAFQMRAQVDF